MTSAAEHLAQLVRIPSVSSLSNRAVIDYAAAALIAHGWTVQERPYRDAAGIEKVNAIAAPPGQSPAQRDVDLAFFCHTDTVPYSASWPQALELTQRGSMLHGCGACDVKGFLACLLAAASACSSVQSGVRIVLTADEEVGCIGASRLIAEDALRPRRAVIGEPTSLRAARAGKGYCLAQVTVRGREAHSAHPAQGVSAIYAAAHVITALEELGARFEREQHHPLFSPAYTTLNIGTITGGSAKNIVPGRAEFLVEWRPIPHHAPEEVLRAIQEELDEVRLLYPGLETKLTPLRQQSGFETPQDASLVQQLQTESGRESTSIAFGSEASAWSAIANEVVVFGPGDMRTAHSERECVPAAELEAATDIVRSFMREISRTV